MRTAQDYKVYRDETAATLFGEYSRMKKIALSFISVLLIATMVGTASASYQGVTKKRVKAYYDKYRTYYATTIPKNTIVKVVNIALDQSAGRNIAKVYAGKNRYLYVYDSLLYSGFDALNNSSSKWSANIIKGSRIYQRPTTASNSVKAKKSISIMICGIKGSWVLVYDEYKDHFGFVKKSSLTNIIE